MQIKAKVIYGNTEKSIEVDSNMNLLSNLLKNDIKMESPCGGKGICGKCKIKILSGSSLPSQQDNKFFTEEELKLGYRLACTCFPSEDITIQLDKNYSESYEILTTEKIQEINDNDFRIMIHEVPIKDDLLEKTNNITSYIDNYLGSKFQYSLSSLNKISNLLKKDINTISSLFVKTSRKKVIDISDKTIYSYGVSIDIGTTTLALSLINMTNGKIINNYSIINPQQKFGYDVISRIQYASEHEQNLNFISDTIITTLDDSIRKLLTLSKVDRDYLDCVAIAGNTTMIQLLLSLDSFSISVSPFTMVTDCTMALTYREVFNNKYIDAEVFLLPAVAAYVGGDITSGIYTTEMYKDDKISILLDIGTNGEMVIGNKDSLMCAATAAGPAFEGAKIKHGIGGVKGAISAVSLSNKTIETIGDKAPIGICGTGVVDIVSEFIDNEIIDETGYLEPEYLDENEEFFIAKDSKGNNISFTQNDVREIQLAKSAILSGIEVLVESYGIDYSQVDKIYLAGGFGTKLHMNQAINIGLIPKELKEKIIPIGNSSLDGAIKFLLNKNAFTHLNNIIQKTNYIELSLNPDFNNKFVENMIF
ncbi:ASKHA domain-containing protein [Clostridium sediminicola]|uniref:ASKHA domain-containing protein n=1 Tax=Clostridium sediminicola TaxID=3114879 RepID=UPI0031F1FDD5